MRRLDDDQTNPSTVSPSIDPLSPVPPEVLAAINEGQEFAALLTLCLETTVTLTLTGGATFGSIRALFPDYLICLRLIGPSGRIRPATLSDLDAANDQWQSTVGTPTRYLTKGFSFMAVSPQPAGDISASMTYARSPAQLTADDFPEMPEAYHASLIDYGCYRIRLKEGGQGLVRGVGYLNRFLDEMVTLGEFVRAKGRAARYDALPFELRTFDRSTLAEQIKKASKWQKVTE